jgi:hypothetical protein
VPGTQALDVMKHTQHGSSRAAPTLELLDVSQHVLVPALKQGPRLVQADADEGDRQRKEQ